MLACKSSLAKLFPEALNENLFASQLSPPSSFTNKFSTEKIRRRLQGKEKSSFDLLCDIIRVKERKRNVRKYSINYSLLCLSNICISIYIYILLLCLCYYIIIAPKIIILYHDGSMVDEKMWFSVEFSLCLCLTLSTLVAEGHIKESYICFCVWKIARILFRFQSIHSCPKPP